MRRKRLDAELGNCLATFGCAKREQRMEDVRSYEGIRHDYNYEKVGIISLAVQRNEARSFWAMTTRTQASSKVVWPGSWSGHRAVVLNNLKHSWKCKVVHVRGIS